MYIDILDEIYIEERAKSQSQIQEEKKSIETITIALGLEAQEHKLAEKGRQHIKETKIKAVSKVLVLL